jgi:hypothetical protein
MPIFPGLRAPNAANLLSGKSLTEVFRAYVIGDAEVVALGKQIVNEEGRHASVFQDGLVTPFGDAHWPLDETADAIEYKFVTGVCGFETPLPSPAISAVAKILADRIRILIDILIAGKVVAFGTFVETGIEGPIGRLQWARSGMSIDVTSGDLCKGQDYRAVALWSGVSFQMPAPPPEPESSRVTVPKSRDAKPQISTKANCLLECSAWLEDMMNASNGIKLFSKAKLWIQAQSKWPNKISKRGFLRAWELAIIKTGALAWSDAGRPKGKS